MILHRRHFLFSAPAVIVALETSCPSTTTVATWISDAVQVLPAVVQTVDAVVTIYAELSGTVSTTVISQINAVSAKVTAGLQELQTLVSQYQAAPNAGIIQSIAAVLQDVENNISQILAVSGVSDPTTQAKIESLIQLALSELTAWQGLIPSSTGATVVAPGAAPLNYAQYKATFNLFVGTMTGNARLDVALRKIGAMK